MSGQQVSSKKSALEQSILQRIRSLGGSFWSGANPSGVVGEHPEPGSHLALMTNVTVESREFRPFGQDKPPIVGVSVRLGFQLVEDPGRVRPRQWWETFSFYPDEIVSRLPQNSQTAMAISRDRLAAFIATVCEVDDLPELPAALNMLADTVNSAYASGNPIVLRVLVRERRWAATANRAAGSRRDTFPQELVSLSNGSDDQQKGNIPF